jgi:molybdopterin molybdotransferase
MPYRTDRSIVTLDEATSLLAAHARAVERTERVPLEQIAGRVLAEDVVAAFDVPPFDRAAMDGYAVIAADLESGEPDAPISLTLIDSVFTGQAPRRSLGRGECIAIATGAPVPSGADAVVMIEQTFPTGGLVGFRTPAQAGQNIGRRGSDVHRGEIILTAGTWLSPARLGVLAALGITGAAVYARPRVAILCTGDEIVAPGNPLGSGQIYDVNTETLAAVVREHGGEPVVFPPVPDERVATAAAFERALAKDLVLVAGGSSVGERDYILETIEARGTVVFQGIAIKPGKPTIFGVADGRPVFGMPGNPTSCLSNAYLLVAPFLRHMARLPPNPPSAVRVRLASAVTSPADRHQFYPVRLVGGEAIPAFKGSGEITSLASADGFFEIPVGVERVVAGEMVDVKRF